MTAVFPQPFRSHDTLRGDGNPAYVVVGMFTASYRPGAERLAASCRKFNIAYELHQVPTIHNSISVRGTDDLAFTKANFILQMLATHKRPVVYIDADCEIMSPLVLIDELVRSRSNFAIYNWCADQSNDRFMPIERRGNNALGVEKRYYVWAGAVVWESHSQLLCSGCVQFYRPSMAARMLLKRWHQTIASMPGCADDDVLDFTFNNLSRWSLLGQLLRPTWLPRTYARQPWWIYDQPVINHPDFPGPNAAFNKLTHPTRKRFYSSQMRRRGAEGRFPPDLIIDTHQGEICKLVNGELVVVAKTDARFWL